MSTRRARIKAVAVLPPRRKNNETDVKTKVKENFEKDLKSPQTPRNNISKNEDRNSPSEKRIKTPTHLLNASKTPVHERVSTPPRPETPKENLIENNTRSEKVPVITPLSTVKNVFASPQLKRSPDKRRIASPVVLPSPKTVKSIELISTQPSNELDNDETCQSRNKINSTPQTNKKNDIPDDYRVPSVPESISDEAVMDGIIPLQTTSNTPKPIDLLKNEIISDCAEVLFDPIVPLPSPSKVRPKLRPAPRLAPHRRNSVQGSASESEDESRRALLGGGAATPAPPRQRHDSHTSHSTLQSVPSKEINRNRNDSVCSSVSQIATTQPPPATSPVKEKHFSKTRRHEMSRRSWWRRREVKRDALTMYDLIFYNPTTNPIVPDQDELNAKEANAKEEAKRSSKVEESEEDVDDPPAAEAAPVPQIKLGPNGEIILDEKSLVIKQSDANRKVTSVVREGSWAGAGGGRYSRTPRTADWSAAETVRFYRALAALGTDFSLMAPLFPDRSRRDLYLKFKKEERMNGAQVDKALRSATSWDVNTLQNEFKKERAEAAKRAETDMQKFIENKKAERERLKISKEMRIRNSRGAKALESAMGQGATTTEMTANEFVRRAIETRAKKAKLQAAEQDTNVAPPKAEAPPNSFATLTLIGNTIPTQQVKPGNPDLATISRVEATQPKQVSLNAVAGVPSNIETGSLVVLRVNDPASPSKTMLQTYIAHGAGKLTPVALPPTFLNSVVGYMKKGTPKSTMSTASSPQLTSPSSVASQDSRSCTPSVIQLNPSPAKRQRNSSFTITSL